MGKFMVGLARVLLFCAVVPVFPALAATQETLMVPFVNGPNGATTTNTYSGSVSINVSGSGQAAATAFSDAFYVFTDNSGNPITPEHHFDFGLCINSQTVDNYLATTPPYSSSHTYQFTIPIGSSPQQITFGVCDTFTVDNSGSFIITVTATPSGNVYTGGKPKGKAPNLIVLVHGCCTDEDEVINDWGWGNESLGTLIKETIIQSHTPRDWEIVVLDWTKDTPDLDFLGAYNKAVKRGHDLSKDIAKHTYEYVHLIGHSAGAHLIDTVAIDLFSKSIKTGHKPFIHLTFLDAYTHLTDELTYGSLADHAEHYVDKSIGFPLTDKNLTYAFNFDITDWVGADKGNPLLFGHPWPIYWYKQSVTSNWYEQTGFRCGYPLSFEGGNDQFDQLATEFPDGGYIKLESIVQTANCDQ